MENQTAPLPSVPPLPIETWNHILCSSSLDIETVLSCLHVCKDWNQSLFAPTIWKNAYRQRLLNRGGDPATIDAMAERMGNYCPALARIIASEYPKQRCYTKGMIGKYTPHLNYVQPPYYKLLMTASNGGTSLKRPESFEPWATYYSYADGEWANNSYCFTSWTFFNDIGEPMDFVFEYGWTCMTAKEQTIYLVLWAIPYGGERSVIYQGVVDTWRGQPFPAHKIDYHYHHPNILKLFHSWLPPTATLELFGESLWPFLKNRMQRFDLVDSWRSEFSQLLGSPWKRITGREPNPEGWGFDKGHGRWHVY